LKNFLESYVPLLIEKRNLFFAQLFYFSQDSNKFPLKHIPSRLTPSPIGWGGDARIVATEQEMSGEYLANSCS
jgi:hypothetical protein